METKNTKRFVKSYVDLEVYKLAFEASREIQCLTSRLPHRGEDPLKIDLRCAARNVLVRIGEAWTKRTYESVFKSKLFDALGFCEETKILFDVARSCAYFDETAVTKAKNKYDRIGAMLYSLITKWNSSGNGKASSRVSRKTLSRSPKMTSSSVA